MCWNSSTCENTKLLDCSIRSVCPQASCLLIKPSQWVFILKTTALQGPPPHQQLQAVLRPPALPQHPQQKTQMPKKEWQGGQRGRRRGKSRRQESWGAPVEPERPHLGSISCLYSQISSFQGELCFQLRRDLSSRYLQILRSKLTRLPCWKSVWVAQQWLGNS